MENYYKDKEKYHKLFPEESISIGGRKFSYRYGGQGQVTMVLLVGGLGVADAFYNHAIKLGQDFKVLLFDYPLDFPTNEELADGIASLIKRLRLRKVYLVGQSYGGFLGQIIATRHKGLVEGLILSNTGCLSKEISLEDLAHLDGMLKRMKRVEIILRVIPISLMRKSFLNRSLKHLETWNESDYSYMKDLFEDIFSKLTNEKERHMCRLMVDLLNISNMYSGDFAYLEDRVLLFLSKDDLTFGEGINKALIELMPCPKVYDDLEGGHVALFLKIDTYCQRIREFVLE